MTCGIYLLTFGENLYYVGQSIDIERRYEEHLINVKKGSASTKMQDAYSAFGLPKHSVLKICNSYELDEYEKFYIIQFNSYYKGLNYNSGGAGVKYGVFEESMFYTLKGILKAYCINKVSVDRLASYLNTNPSIVIDLLAGNKYTMIRDAFPELYDIAIDKYKDANKTINTYPTIINDKGEEVSIPYRGASKFAKENNLNPANLSKLLKGSAHRCGTWKRAY